MARFGGVAFHLSYLPVGLSPPFSLRTVGTMSPLVFRLSLPQVGVAPGRPKQKRKAALPPIDALSIVAAVVVVATPAICFCFVSSLSRTRFGSVLPSRGEWMNSI